MSCRPIRCVVHVVQAYGEWKPEAHNVEGKPWYCLSRYLTLSLKAEGMTKEVRF